VEHKGEVWVASGDYKTEIDATCEPFAPVRCHTFITESTFALPIYRWQPQTEIFRDLDLWRAQNAARGVSSVIFCYSLGKAQRVLAGVDPTITPIVLHNTVENFLPIYRSEGITFPETITERSGSEPVLVIAPQSTLHSEWLGRFAPFETAFASGWMLIRKMRRRSYEKGIVLSDHADWNGLLDTIDATGAEKILVTHGYTEQLVRHLREQGKDADVIKTHFER
jgi:putative mRNA 3-end processing factor